MIGSSGAGLPMPARMGDGADAGGGGDQDHPHHFGTSNQASGIVCGQGDNPRADASKDGAVLPMGSAGTFKGRKTTLSMHAPWSSQVVRDEERHNIDDPGRCYGKSPQHHSRDA